MRRHRRRAPHADCGAAEAARRRKELSSKLWDHLCGSTNTPLVLRLPLWGLRNARWLVPNFLRSWVRVFCVRAWLICTP